MPAPIRRDRHDYASDHYQRVLAAEGITCSTSEVGQCWDNARVESFFGRLKCEIEEAEMFATRDQARAALFEYLEVFYNRVRRHSSLGFVSPAEFERAYSMNHRSPRVHCSRGRSVRSKSSSLYCILSDFLIFDTMNARI